MERTARVVVAAVAGAAFLTGAVAAAYALTPRDIPGEAVDITPIVLETPAAPALQPPASDVSPEPAAPPPVPPAPAPQIDDGDDDDEIDDEEIDDDELDDDS
ncbi:hypothetical protein [Salinibacterium sp. ZJ77]|uniref:hypothetical protein n=1 Tax=Salinibacterium sp. ZJ77 TaxID=2708337 RepID=UPI0014227EBE|nr:hypothetical protein [Salinibacterium sp. ZJ77]